MANPLPNFEEIIQLLDKEIGYVSTPNIKYDIPSIPTLVNPTFKNLSRVSNLVLMPCWTLKKKKTNTSSEGPKPIKPITTPSSQPTHTTQPTQVPLKRLGLGYDVQLLQAQL